MRAITLTRSTEGSRKAVDKDWASPSHVHGLVLMAATGIGLFLCYKVATPFLSAFSWALTLAVLFAPLQVRLENRNRWPSVAAGFTVVGGLLFFGPAGLILGPVTLTVTQSLLDVWPKRGSANPVLANATFNALMNPKVLRKSESIAIARFENEGGAIG